MLRFILKFFGGGVLDRALDTVDRSIEARNDRERIKADMIQEHMRTRIGWLQAGGFWTLLLFAVPSAFHYGAVAVYSVFWCRGCVFPQEWSVAAMPGVMATWEQWIILASIGGLSLFSWRRR